MTALPTTGIPVIDRELEQHKFADADEAEAAVARLLAVWRALHSNGDDAAPYGRSRQAHRR
jgi:hypothetical protein